MLSTLENVIIDEHLLSTVVSIWGRLIWPKKGSNIISRTRLMFGFE